MLLNPVPYFYDVVCPSLGCSVQISLSLSTLSMHLKTAFHMLLPICPLSLNAVVPAQQCLYRFQWTDQYSYVAVLAVAFYFCPFFSFSTSSFLLELNNVEQFSLLYGLSCPLLSLNCFQKPLKNFEHVQPQVALSSTSRGPLRVASCT